MVQFDRCVRFPISLPLQLCLSILQRFRDIITHFAKFKDVTWPWTHPFRVIYSVHTAYFQILQQDGPGLGMFWLLARTEQGQTFWKAIFFWFLRTFFLHHCPTLHRMSARCKQTTKWCEGRTSNPLLYICIPGTWLHSPHYNIAQYIITLQAWYDRTVLKAQLRPNQPTPAPHLNWTGCHINCSYKMSVVSLSFLAVAPLLAEATV